MMHRTIVCVVWLLEFIATHAPISKQVEALPGTDKHLHLSGYFVLSALLMFWNGVGAAGTWRRVRTVILILAVYAVADELLQPLVGRDADVMDWTADVAGAIVGAVAGLTIARLTMRSRAE